MTAWRFVLRRFGTPTVVLVLAGLVTASASGVVHYTIKSGDTLSSIAARHHTTVQRLVHLNHLPAGGDLIYAGDVLKIPGNGGGVGAHAHRGHHSHHGKTHHARAQHRTRVRITTYTVKPGDSLYAIAARFHAHPDAIAHRNHLPSSLVVVIGQKLRIAHEVRVHRHSTHVASHGFPGVGGVDRRRFRGIHVPSRQHVAAMIRRTAARWHVDPRLALAISYMEAGFNQRMVSGYGAIGAMQVMPATGRWISQNVVHRHLHLLRARDDVTAGVALLSVLLHATGGNQKITAAGYYQGLASVRAHGMYDDTKRYVSTVLALRNRF